MWHLALFGHFEEQPTMLLHTEWFPILDIPSKHHANIKKTSPSTMSILLTISIVMHGNATNQDGIRTTSFSISTVLTPPTW